MDSAWIVNFLAAAVVSGTPLVIAGLGELISEESGSLNLGVEGMMYMGAVMGFYFGLQTESAMMAVLGSFLAGMTGALIFGFLTISMRANQIVTGLTLTLFGTGFAGFAGASMVGQKAPDAIMHVFQPVKIPLLGDIPFLGNILFNHDILIYFSFLLVIIAGLYLYTTRMGLNLRIVGENPAAADALGIPVGLYKYLHLLIGGGLCGFAGGYLSLVYVPAWQDSLIAGRGWIAVALVIFSKWNPFKLLLGALFFGGLDIIGFRLQKFDLPVSQYVLDVLPYAMTILIMITDAVRSNSISKAPRALGESYFREER